MQDLLEFKILDIWNKGESCLLQFRMCNVNVEFQTTSALRWSESVSSLRKFWSINKPRITLNGDLSLQSEWCLETKQTMPWVIWTLLCGAEFLLEPIWNKLELDIFASERDVVVEAGFDQYLIKVKKGNCTAVNKTRGRQKKACHRAEWSLRQRIFSLKQLICSFSHKYSLTWWGIYSICLFSIFEETPSCGNYEGTLPSLIGTSSSTTFPHHISKLN